MNGVADDAGCITSRAASICAMLRSSATETSMTDTQIARYSSMIHALAADAEGSRTMCLGSTLSYETTHSTLGEDEFAVVVKATHSPTGEAVALKTWRGWRRGGTGMRAPYPFVLCELLREACFMAGSAGHPSLLALRGIARTPGTKKCSIVTEYVGPSLRQVLRGGPFPEADVRGIVRQLLAGAEAMRKRGVVHCDVNPSSIFVGEDDIIVKIGGFGSAAFGTAERKQQAPAYVSPELLLGKPDCDAFVDLWSVGCVMAELLSGKSLFLIKGDEIDDRDQLHKIFDVLGVPGKKTWRALKPQLFEEEVKQWRQAQPHKRKNRLRELFPEELLSKDGFEVLQGLLTCNPTTRLDAAAALRLPWFAHNDDDKTAPPPVASVPAPTTPKPWLFMSLFGRALDLIRPKAMTS